MSAPMTSGAADTRRRLLQAAYDEFYRQGFQGGSLNRIVAAADATKGALFHHFAGKQELGYAVIDELIEPPLLQRWLAPLAASAAPLPELKRAFRRFVRDDIRDGTWLLGCPLNNLAQEMSPLDAGFRRRIDRLYTLWRSGIAVALAGGIKAGTVRKNVVPAEAAAMLVAAQMGIWGTGKSSRNRKVMLQAAAAVCQYLDTLSS